MNAFDCFIKWNVSPKAFSIGQLDLRYYGLFLITAFISASIVFYLILKRENQSLFLLPVTLNAVFLSALIGARLGECLFYFPEYYLNNPLEIFIPFKNGVYTGIGGLSSHGAAFAIPPALYLTAKNRKIPVLWLMDKVCVTIPLAAFFIRLGNLFNSEILGTETSVFWGFIFEQRNEDFPRHPVQLYEAVCYLAIFFFLYNFYKRTQNKIPQGTILGLFLSLTFFSRFVLETFKAPLNAFDQNSLFNTGQYLSLIFIFAGAIIILISSLKGKL
ncbi:MAG: prolipoprotein diacylglyceryl transferase [Prevotellaceae bacterium]|jgi:prolipoprotein diacylglyceryl transferase|nr:prolipoprotein diacylglyceryl transferase [Prevotellaceae bacterium]